MRATKAFLALRMVALVVAALLCVLMVAGFRACPIMDPIAAHLGR